MSAPRTTITITLQDVPAGTYELTLGSGKPIQSSASPPSWRTLALAAGANKAVIQPVSAPTPPPTPPTPPPAPSGNTFEAMTAPYIPLLPSSAPQLITSASQFASAMAGAKSGDYFQVQPGVWMSAVSTAWQRVITGGVVVVEFLPGSGFTGGTVEDPAVYVHNSGGWQIHGGQVSNPGWHGIVVYDTPGPFTWTGFTCTDFAAQGVFVAPTLPGTVALIENVTLIGVSGSTSQNLAADPHAEKGTGLHAWNLADASTTLNNCVFGCDVLNQATGAGVQLQQDAMFGCTLIVRAKNLGSALAGTTWKGYAQQQVAGNAIQIWDNGGAGTVDVKGVWADTIMGRIVDTNGAGGNLSGIKVEYGAALGPTLLAAGISGSSIHGSNINYEAENGLVLGNCTPLP